jgi:hypothetical protein
MAAMRRSQFRLSTLLWITLAVACWFGGMRVGQWRRDEYSFSPRDMALVPLYHRQQGQLRRLQIERFNERHDALPAPVEFP